MIQTSRTAALLRIGESSVPDVNPTGTPTILMCCLYVLLKNALGDVLLQTAYVMKRRSVSYTGAEHVSALDGRCESYYCYYYDYYGGPLPQGLDAGAKTALSTDALNVVFRLLQLTRRRHRNTGSLTG